MQVNTYSLCKSLQNLYNEMVDLNASFIRKAKHARDTHLTSSYNGKLQFQHFGKSQSKEKLPWAAKKLLAHVIT